MGQLSGLTAEKIGKRKPVKAQPITDKDGGIFTAKIVAIWNKLFGRKNG